jgi:hypothetical protein
MSQHKRRRLGKYEQDAVLEQLTSVVWRAMEAAKGCGVPAKRVQVCVEELAVNWEPVTKLVRRATRT